MTFSDRIKQIRGNLTQKEFAANLGVSLGSVQHWEIDNTPANGSALIKIREAFKVNLNWLLTGSGQPYDDTAQAAIPGQPEITNVIELQHMALVRGFRDKQTGLSLNQNLIKLEALDSKSFYQIEGYIRGTVDSLQKVLPKIEDKGHEQNGDKDSQIDRPNRPAANR